MIQWILSQSSSKLSISRIRLLLIKSRLKGSGNATPITDSLAVTSCRSDPEAELASVSDDPSYDAVSRSSRPRSRLRNSLSMGSSIRLARDRAGESLDSSSMISTSSLFELLRLDLREGVRYSTSSLITTTTPSLFPSDELLSVEYSYDDGDSRRRPFFRNSLSTVLNIRRARDRGRSDSSSLLSTVSSLPPYRLRRSLLRLRAPGDS